MSKMNESQIRQQLLASGNVSSDSTGGPPVVHTRTKNPEASRNAAIAARRAEMHGVQQKKVKRK